MVISDKQELRRCVKQAVRRACVCESDLSFDVMHGSLGVSAMLDLWARPAPTASESLKRSCADQTPFAPEAVAMFAALDAMGFPVQDLDRAVAVERSYDRNAYIREVLDALKAKCVLVRVPVDMAQQIQFEDNRFSPLRVVDRDLFTPGRFGIDYASVAKRIADSASICEAENLLMTQFDESALQYCVMPICQDEGIVLHIHLESLQDIERFSLMLDQFDGVRAVVSASAELQATLIDAAVSRVRMLVRLTEVSFVSQALTKLGVTRFAVYGACASLPEIMLGRWISAKEEIWQALSEAYLPLARAGYELQSAAIERDIGRIMCGNLLSLCKRRNME